MFTNVHLTQETSYVCVPADRTNLPTLCGLFSVKGETQIPPLILPMSVLMEVLSTFLHSTCQKIHTLHHVVDMVHHFTKFAVHRRYFRTGPCFEGKFFQEWCYSLGIRKSNTTSYQTQGHGICDKFNCTLKQQ